METCEKSALKECTLRYLKLEFPKTGQTLDWHAYDVYLPKIGIGCAWKKQALVTIDLVLGPEFGQRRSATIGFFRPKTPGPQRCDVESSARVLVSLDVTVDRKSQTNGDPVWILDARLEIAVDPPS